MEKVKTFSLTILLCSMLSCSVAIMATRGKDGKPGKNGEAAKNGSNANDSIKGKDGANGKDGAKAEFNLINLQLKTKN